MTIDRGAVGRPGPVEGLAQLLDRRDATDLATEGGGMAGEVDTHRGPGRVNVGPQVVERLAALADLQALDHRESTVVADDDDHLVPGQHRGVQVAVEHQVRPVTDEHDRVPVGCQGAAGHRRTPAARQLVTHAREPVLAVERGHGVRPPPVVQLAGKATRRGEGVVVGGRPLVDHADDLGIGRQPIAWVRPAGRGSPAVRPARLRRGLSTPPGRATHRARR